MGGDVAQCRQGESGEAEPAAGELDDGVIARVVAHRHGGTGASLDPRCRGHLTGIGGEAWTDDKIKRAIHDGLNADGSPLCTQMEHYQFTDAQLSDLVVFLRNLDPVVKNITLACTN